MNLVIKYSNTCLNSTLIDPFLCFGIDRWTKKSLQIPKGVIRIHKLKKDRQHNGQKKKYRRTNNDQQGITHKTKDQVTQTH